MYSVVMMMAMASAPETPNCGRPVYSTYCVGCYGGCAGCYGGCAGCYGVRPARRCGCHGYANCYGCQGCIGYQSGIVIIGQQVTTVDSMRPTVTTGIPSNDGAKLFASASIEVSLPKDAKLFVDDYQATSQGMVRLLATPPLEPEKDFTYTLSATVVRNQKEIKVQNK